MASIVSGLWLGWVMDRMREHSTRGDAATVGAASGPETARTGGTSAVPFAVEDVRDGLAGVDPALLSDPDRIALVAALGRLKAAAAAAQVRLTAAFAAGHGIPTDAFIEHAEQRRVVGAEAGLARRESPSKGDQWVRHALVLANDLPRTLAALERATITEDVARCVAEEAGVLDRRRRRELDERLAEALHHLSVRSARQTCQRITAEIDADAMARRMRRAKARRRVTMRPIGDGMAYLSILGTATDVLGAYQCLRQDAQALLAGGTRTEGLGVLTSALALARLSGRDIDQAQPVTVNIVMTDRSLLGWGEQSRSTEEPALVGLGGAMPADVARELLADPEVEAFFRRLITSPNGRDLVAMGSVSRIFPAGLRSMITLRDQHCRTPFCDAPIRTLDHINPHRDHGPTSYRNGQGYCLRCNLTKESEAYACWVRGSPDEGHPHRDDSGLPHEVLIRTPSGQEAASLAPPILGWGWQIPPELEDAPDRWPTPAQTGTAAMDQFPTESWVERALRIQLDLVA